MKTPPIVSPEEWHAAREQLLIREKELTLSLEMCRRSLPSTD